MRSLDREASTLQESRGADTRKESRMDVLTAHESLTMLTRLEECVTALEDDRSPGLFYTVIILAQEFATKTKAPFSDFLGTPRDTGGRIAYRENPRTRA